MVFARAPVPGEAKTRLIPALGPDGAAELHRRLLLRTLETIRAGPKVLLQLWCSPTCDHPVFRYARDHLDVTLHLQSVGDLGQRMEDAFSSALQTHDFALLIGSDCPSLSTELVEHSLRALDQGQDAVIAPAQDGGYVLLGLRQVHESLFTGIPWGERDVAALTRSRMEALGWRYLELPKQWDVDVPADLSQIAGLLD